MYSFALTFQVLGRFAQIVPVCNSISVIGKFVECSTKNIVIRDSSSSSQALPFSLYCPLLGQIILKSG
jgi:hypothetical protein